MRYNKYVAVGFVNNAIQTTAPHNTFNGAAQTFFKENRTAHTCSVKRVAVRASGDIITDPEFKMKKMGKINA